MQALGWVRACVDVLNAQWVSNYVSEDTINLRRDDKRGRTSMGKTQLSLLNSLNNSSLQCHKNKKANLMPKKT